MKSQVIKERILECAKAEFLKEGYSDASLRVIAQNAGVTTGSLYNRFKSKDQLFHELVGEAATKLLDYFKGVQEDFASLKPSTQRELLHTYSDDKLIDMIDIIYDNFDSFYLIVCRGVGSSYEGYIDKLVDIETASSFRFNAALSSAGLPINGLREDLTHILSSALFNGIFEVVAHRMPREDADKYIQQITDFFAAGWDRLLGF